MHCGQKINSKFGDHRHHFGSTATSVEDISIFKTTNVSLSKKNICKSFVLKVPEDPEVVSSARQPFGRTFLVPKRLSESLGQTKQSFFLTCFYFFSKLTAYVYIWQVFMVNVHTYIHTNTSLTLTYTPTHTHTTLNYMNHYVGLLYSDMDAHSFLSLLYVILIMFILSMLSEV